jgi:hypothetical protein
MYRTLFRPSVVSLCLSFLVVLTEWLQGQGPELVDTERLEGRGLALEFEGTVASGLRDAQGIGDVNGDGLADVAIAAHVPSDIIQSPWAVVVLYGQPGLSGHQALGDFPRLTVFRPLHGSGGDRGTRADNIHGIGDVNSDGFADFAFGFSPYRTDTVASDVAFIVYGGIDLEGELFVEAIGSTVPGVMFFSSNPEHESVGFHIIKAGDFNGDDREDVAISAPTSSPLGRREGGAVCVIFDARNLPSVVDLAEVGKTVPGIWILGGILPVDAGVELPADDPRLQTGVSESLGYGLASAGDFDGDGFSDLLASGYFGLRRALYLFRGAATYATVTDLGEILRGGEHPQLTVFAGPLRNLVFAEPGQFASAGDIDGDGRSELVMGVSRHGTSGEPGSIPIESTVYIVRGRSDLPPRVDMSLPLESLAYSIVSPQEGFFGSMFGGTVASAGDVNRDGILDIVIGAPRGPIAGKDKAGEAFAVYMQRQPESPLRLGDGFSGLRIQGEAAYSGLGAYAAPAGDFNGDGAPDLLVAAPNIAARSQLRVCRVYIIYGIDQSSLPLRLLSVLPRSGTKRGGTMVTIHGTGFSQGIEVVFGAIPSPSVEILSGTTIRARTPPTASLGPVNVHVRNGVSSDTLPAAFDYTRDYPSIDLRDLGSRGLAVQGGADIRIGESLTLGDVTGDGTADLVIGSGREGGWLVTIVHGGPSVQGPIPAETASDRVAVLSGAPRTFPGANVGRLGDVNGDGVEDLGIGASEALGYIVFGGSRLRGEIDVELETKRGLSVRLERPPFHGRFQFVALGDVRGDGLEDFAVGLSGASKTLDSPLPAAGEILFIRGRVEWPEAMDVGANSFARLHGFEDLSALGEELSGAGDVNGDGLLDLLASASGITTSARAYLLHGTDAVPAESDVEVHLRGGGGIILERPRTDFFTTASLHVSGAGDVTGDGYPDFLVGDEIAGNDRQGMTFLIHGGPELSDLLLSEEPEIFDSITRIRGEAPGAQSGQVGPAGDYDGDGVDDFLIGSHAADALQAGSISLVFGSSDLPAVLDLGRAGLWVQRIEQTFPPASIHVTREVADINADGVVDLAFAEAIQPGGAYVIYGLATQFIRGDSDSDGTVNITDGIAILIHLFLGGPQIRCSDAGDVNDEGLINMTDAIYLLRHLFLGETAPPSPYPNPGYDETDDVLRCPAF